MKKLISSIAVVALMLTAMAFTFSSSGDDNTISGKLVDSKCYSMMPKANAGNDHMVMGKDGKMMEVKSCATACASMGIPVALLTKSGKLFVLAVPANQLASYMDKEARIEGKDANGVFIADKIEVKDGKKWSEVKISYMM